jgi:hypothetical protein
LRCDRVRLHVRTRLLLRAVAFVAVSARILLRTWYVIPCMSLVAKWCHTFFWDDQNGSRQVLLGLNWKNTFRVQLCGERQCLLSIRSPAVACAVQCCAVQLFRGRSIVLTNPPPPAQFLPCVSRRGASGCRSSSVSLRWCG